MKFFDLLKFALSNVWAQKLRTVLTLLAITVGAFLVFLLPSFGLGVADQIRSQFDSENLKSITVNPRLADGAIDFSATNVQEPKFEKRLTAQDVETLKNLPKVAGIREVRMSLSPTKIHFDSINKNIKSETDQITERTSGSGPITPPTQFQSIVPGLGIENYKLDLVAGRFLEAKDNSEGNIVINKAIVDGLNLDNPGSLIGKTITMTFFQNDPSESSFGNTNLKRYTFTIVGIAKSKESSNFPMDTTPTIIIPFNKTWEIIQWQESPNKDFQNKYSIDSLELEAKENDQVESLSTELKGMGFDTFSSLDMIKSFQQAVNIALGVLASFGLIALFVGALNIINTLMMSVTERTKEIGILRALGASRATIRRVFLLESAVIALLGGLVGVFGGWIASLLINLYLVHRFAAGDTANNLVPDSFFSYSPLLILGVLAFITLIGLIAGIAPAIRASRLNVVDALRYE